MTRLWNILLLGLILCLPAMSAHSTSVVVPSSPNNGPSAYRVIKHGNKTYIVKQNVIDVGKAAQNAANNPNTPQSSPPQPPLAQQPPANNINPQFTPQLGAVPAITPPAGTGTCYMPPNVIGMSVEALKNISMNNPVRILGPNTPATMDYSPDRTNFMVDGRGVVYAVRCG